MIHLRTVLCWTVFVLAVVGSFAYGQGTNINVIGRFEADLPSYWTKGNEPAGSTLSWATDQSVSLGHSLKITKGVTSDSSAWISENMVDNWSPRHYGSVDMKIGAWVKTQGVNTTPVSEDQKWYVLYAFYDSAGVLFAQTKLPIDQSVATSTGFVADTNGVGTTVLPKDSWKTIIKFVGGKNATGTVWADDFILYGRAGAWAGQDWNTSVGVPAGWWYYLPPNGGNDAVLGSGFENTLVTTEAAHSGLRSLKFNLPFGRSSRDGFVAAKRLPFNNIDAGIKEGDVLRISVWLKASNLVPDSAAKDPVEWSVGFTRLWFNGVGNNIGYDPPIMVGPPNDNTTYHFIFPPVTQFDWTQYYLDVTVPTGVNAKALEVRLHAHTRFTGTIYWDDLTVEKLEIPQLSEAGGFEGDLPSYWTKGNEPAGSTLSWATDQSVSLGHSLKITKGVTSDSSAWISENMVDNWSPRHYGSVDMKIGAWVKTQGVNTTPVSEDQKWYVLYAFYDSAGVLFAQTKLPIDQSVATSTGFVADTNGVGTTVLPKDSWKTIIKFVGGKNATGTVWADDFILYGRAGAWAGQDWNTSVGVPAGWWYYLPPNGGNDAVLGSGFENTLVTTEAAHSGLRSLKFNLPFGRSSRDGFVAAKRTLLNGVNPAIKEGDVLRISVWLKASNLVPDSAAKDPVEWSVGFTRLWFNGVGNNIGYDPPIMVGPPNDNTTYHFIFPPVTQFDWTQYYLDVTVPTGVNAKALEVRLHAHTRFTGTIYWDDLTVEKLEIPQLSEAGGFEGDLPSYWTKGNEPAGSTLSWATDQSVSLGHSLKITKGVTSDSSAWISENMVDNWSPRHYGSVDMKIGAWVKTQGVNTTPVSEDQKWYVLYAFYDSAGVLFAQTKLPIDQSVATSTGFVADTNGVGTTVLPKDSWKTIIKFVGGKNATGTVWADDFILYGRAGAWAGQDWNTSVGVPAGWWYYLPPNGGNDAVLGSGFENTLVTTEAAHSGLRSLKFNLPFGRSSRDGFVAAKRTLLNGVNPAIKEGDVLRISVWLKASNLVPDSAAKDPVEWSVGFTRLWFNGVGNNIGYDPPIMVGPPNDNTTYHFIFPPVTQFDWTQYYLDVTVPTGVNAKALEVRLHAHTRFTGTIYWDDLTVELIGSTTGVKTVADGVPKTFELANNYPNPFNPSTVIQYGVPHDGAVSLVIYNILGQQVRTLVDMAHAAGRYTISWDGRDDAGLTMGTGVYFYRLQAGTTNLVRKMLLLK